MGLTVNLCNDVEKYEESVFGGFSVKKVLYILAAVLAGGATMAFSYFVVHVPIIVSVYLMVPVVIPIIMKGFYGTGRGSWLNILLTSMKKGAPLVYQSTEAADMTVVEDENGKKKRSEKQIIRTR